MTLTDVSTIASNMTLKKEGTPEVNKLLESAIGFIDRSNLQILDLRSGYCKCLIPLEGNENHIGTMYAGALFTLAEAPGGFLSLSSFDSEKYFPVVRDMQIKFCRAAKTDITIELSISHGEISQLEKCADVVGKVDFELKGELKDMQGEIVAISTGLYQIRSVDRKI